jgi:glycerol uptake facilitator protein
MNNSKVFWGEFIGTFIIVLFGCGSVASAILFDSFGSLYEIAMVWFIGVSLAIYASNNFSDSHLNPAVSLAFTIAGMFPIKKLPLMFAAQFSGAFSAAAFLYFIFSGFISDFESTNQIIRGTQESIVTASMFGEYFPNPGFSLKIKSVSSFQAFVAESVGTFVLVFMIFWLTAENNKGKFTPMLIGLTVAALITLLAPISQGGFNPARDFGPRLFSYFAGWGNVVFQKPSFSFFTVYILGPFVGASIAAILYKFLLKLK